jgi:hypothetical protein
MVGQLLVTGWRGSRIGQEQSETKSAGHRGPEADVWTPEVADIAMMQSKSLTCRLTAADRTPLLEAGMHGTISFIG